MQEHDLDKQENKQLYFVDLELKLANYMDGTVEYITELTDFINNIKDSNFAFVKNDVNGNTRYFINFNIIADITISHSYCNVLYEDPSKFEVWRILFENDTTCKELFFDKHYSKSFIQEFENIHGFDPIK